MTNQSSISSRHPIAILICELDDEAQGVAQVISDQVKEFRTFPYDKNSFAVIKEFKPYVILFALHDVMAAVKFYSEAVTEDIVNYPHEAILLCQNKESGAAFRCCIKGLFNDYFVYKPMFENYRLKMIVHNALLRHGESAAYSGLQEKHFGKIDTELKEIIDGAVSFKNDSLAILEQITNSPKSTNSNENSDMMSSLEDAMKNQLEGLVEQLVSQKLAQQTHNNALNQLEQDKRPTPEAFQEVKESSETDELPPCDEPKRILIVEDNEIYRELISRILISENFHVTMAVDGKEALEVIQTVRFDLILMDLYMPELDGINTTKQIRKLIGNSSPPIVALTGNQNKEIIRRWATYGLQGYIIKPSSKVEILKAVKSVLEI